jgi:hypothetical protein
VHSSLLPKGLDSRSIGYGSSYTASCCCHAAVLYPKRVRHDACSHALSARLVRAVLHRTVLPFGPNPSPLPRLMPALPFRSLCLSLLALYASAAHAGRQCKLVVPQALAAAPPQPSASARASVVSGSPISSAAPSASATPLTTFRYGHQPIRGVNLCVLSQNLPIPAWDANAWPITAVAGLYSRYVSI